MVCSNNHSFVDTCNNNTKVEVASGGYLPSIYQATLVWFIGLLVCLP